MADIVNPYIAGNPVTGTEMFFDREDVFDFIRRTLVGKHRDNVIVLYGQRRTGKTSVLYQMRFRLDTRYLCIFIDLHGFALQGLDGFLWGLANHIIRVLRRDYQIALPCPSREEFVADPRSFFENEFLNQIWSAVGDRHILLMLDEAIRLQEQVETGKLEHEIFEYLRHLMQHYERLNFLFSLSSGLEEMEKEYSFLFNVGLYKKISFLDRNATRDLITQPVKDCYQVEPDAVERICHITSGHPYYTQLVCHCLFNCWVQQHTPHIGVQDVDEVLNEAVERGSAVLKQVWDESTPAEKAILASMASTMSHFNDVADANDINRAWADYHVVIPKGEMAKAIRSLIARDVIAGQDKYTFTVDLQRLWVQKHKRVAWVKQEIADAIREWSSDLILHIPHIVVSVLILVLILTSASVFALFRQASPYGWFGTLALSDPLHDSSRGYWHVGPDDVGGDCEFLGNAYHVSQSRTNYFQSCSEPTDFSNSAFEAQMTIVKGDCGGLEFRSDRNTGKSYDFVVCQNGSYMLVLYVDFTSTNSKTLISGSSSAIHTGLNASNVIAVVANGSTLDLYVNMQKIASVTDSTSSRGVIGLIAYLSYNNPTEVVYSNARVWKF